MFNRKTKTISRVPSKEEGVEMIGTEIDGKVITNIEKNGQVRVLTERQMTKENITPDPERWKQDYKEIGLKFHEGTLLSEHDSEEVYEKYHELINQ